MVSFVTNVGSPLTETVTNEDSALASVWKVIVLNDPVNLMSYVSMIFKRVFKMSDTEADKHMLEVHEQGRSIVWTGDREKAETYLYQLHEWHLQAILERDERD